MLALIRRFAKSPAASVLLTLLVASFAVFGISDVFRNVGQRDAVVSAGGRTVGAMQFRTMFDRYLQGLAQQNGGQPPTIAEAAAQGADARALQEVAYEEAAAAAIAAAGVRPGDAQVAAELAKAQRFRNPVTGAFDKKAYADFLREQKITAKEVEGSLADQIAQRHFLTGLVAALQPPRIFTAVAAAVNGERRDFTYVSVPASSVPAPAPPTDAELQKFLNENAAQLRKPETRRVSLVRFSAAQLAPTLPVDAKEVQRRFDFEKDTLSIPERRSVVQIPLKSAAQAADVVARLKRGEAPAAAARAVGAEPVVSPDAPRSALPDPAVAAAAFAMAAGEVRGPVQGALGASVVQVTKITPGREAQLADARPRLEAAVRQAAAVEKADELAGKYDDARSGGANLAEAAAKAGVQVQALPPFTKDGQLPDGQRLPVPKKLIATAYSLPAGGESELLQAGPGESYAIRVEAVTPSAPFALAEVRGPLTARLTQQKLAEALSARAEALAGQARAKGSLDGLGAVQRIAGVDRSAAQGPRPAYPPALLARVFSLKPGEVAVAPGEGSSAVVVRLERITPAPAQQIALVGRASRRPATLGLYDDLAAHAREAARAQVKPKVDAARARRALGLEPDAKPAATPAAGA